MGDSQRPTSSIQLLYSEHQTQIEKILRECGILRLVAFGSRARGDVRPESDLDLSAEIDPDAPPLALLSAEIELEDILHLNVNLVVMPNEKLDRVLEEEGVRLYG